jgi:hypothetical protein
MSSTDGIRKILDRVDTLSRLDLSLIDVKDENLVALLTAFNMVISLSQGTMSEGVFVGFIGQAYAAGRTRGRKESVMMAMLDGVDGVADREEG